jgi:hypothetical protein
VIDHAAIEQRLDGFVDFQVIALRFTSLFDEGLDYPLVDGIAPSHHHAGEVHRLANLQIANDFIADGNGYFAHSFLSFQVSLRARKAGVAISWYMVT